jgi:hypothetical protein
VETIALLTRAMQKRPELTLHDLRPIANNRARLIDQPDSSSAASALREDQVQQRSIEKRADSLKELEASQ